MKTLRVFAFLLLAGGMPAMGQSLTFTAGKIQFTNPGPYSEAQLEAAAGMHAGTKFTAEDLTAAAQRLADTGYFSDVGAKTLPGRVAAVTVEFEITPLDRSQMLHLTFENFVWLTRAEIVAALQTKAQLFLGYCPSNSQLLDSFSDALSDALARKGIKAKVMHDVFEPALTRPEIDVDYWVSSPASRIGSVKLEGVSTDLAPLIQKPVNSLAGKAYRDGLPGGRVSEQILAPLWNAGYIDASLSDPSISAASPGDFGSVMLSATLHAGDAYYVSGISFAGSPLLSAADFASTVKLHPGDVASRAKLLETLQPLDAAYRRAGYADVMVRADPKEDAATHQVAYTVTVTPGEPYRIQSVTPDGLDAAGKAVFDKEFTLKTGDIYNPEYVKDFLKHNSVLQNPTGSSFSYKAYADPGTHTVDLVVSFGGVQQSVTIFGGQ